MHENRPFRVIINYSLEVHNLEDSGECSGHIVPTAKLKEYGIKSHGLMKIDGQNLHDALMKVKEKLS